MALMIDNYVLAQAITYALIAMCGLAMAVPMGFLMTTENYSCMLYMGWTWHRQSTKKDPAITSEEGPRANCDFVMFLSVVGGIVKGTIMAIYYVQKLTLKDPYIGAKIWGLPNVLISGAAAGAFFIAACIDSVGFKVFCDGFLSGEDTGHYFETCSDLRTFNWVDINNGDQHNGRTVYNMFQASMATSWIMVLLWLLQVGLGIARVVRNRRLGVQQSGGASTPATSDLEHVAAPSTAVSVIA